MILDILSSHPVENRVRGLIDVALNSAMHLESLIEDALDLTRLENNRFKINMEAFDISKTL